MIRVAPLSDRTGRYYLDDLAPEVTDLFGASAPGRWDGRAAAGFGLVGEVEAGDLAAVLEGCPPGSTLRPSARRSRSAFDMIIAAPKPVSILFASPDPTIARATVRAHHAGVADALDYLEHRAAAVERTRSGDRLSVAAEGLTAAGFTHGLSRGGDPHLHTHLVVANLARGGDGRFGALDGRSLLLHAPTADALYRATLRLELATTLDVRWQIGRDGREQLAGISDAQQIAVSGRAADARAGVRSVPDKVHLGSREAALAIWHERLRTAPTLADEQRGEARCGVVDEHRFAAALSWGTPRARHVAAAFANAASFGVDARVVATVLRSIAVELGHGAREVPLAPRAIMPAPSVLRRLGPRPTERGAHAAWQLRADDLGRSLSDLSVPERALTARLVR